MNIRAIIAELVGVFTLCFVGIGAIAATVAAAPGVALVAAAIAHGLAILVMVGATAATSGAHLNPAVTIAMLVAGRIKVLDAILYIVGQCLGALAGVAAIGAVVGEEAISTASYGLPALATGVTQTQGIIAEACATFLLVFVIFGVAVKKGSPVPPGVAIRFTVTAGIFAIGGVTGAALNPARWVGPALASGTTGEALIYWVGPVLGAIVAALLWQFVLLSKEDKQPEAGS